MYSHVGGLILLIAGGLCETVLFWFTIFWPFYKCLTKKFFHGKKLFFKNWGFKKKSESIPFLFKSISRPMIFSQTTRQRGGWIWFFYSSWSLLLHLTGRSDNFEEKCFFAASLRDLQETFERRKSSSSSMLSHINSRKQKKFLQTSHQAFSTIDYFVKACLNPL